MSNRLHNPAPGPAEDPAVVHPASREHVPGSASPWPQPGEPMAWPRLVAAAAAMALTVAALTFVAYTAATSHPMTAVHAIEAAAVTWLVLAGLGLTQVVAARGCESVTGAELALFAALLATVVYAATTDQPALAVAAAVPYLAFDVITMVRPRRLHAHARAAVVSHLSRCEDCGHAVPDTAPAGLMRRVTALDRRGWRLELVDGLICPACTCDRYGHRTIAPRLVGWIGPTPTRCRRCGVLVTSPDGGAA